MLNIIIEKGLLKSFRKMKLKVTLIDKPGSLQKLSDLIASTGANIVQIDYDRTSTSLDFGDAYVQVSLETKGKEHQNRIKAMLKENDILFTED
jgi:threonine dehydratase